MKKKYYFVVKTIQGDVITLVAKGKDLKRAQEKLLTSFKGNIKEILSVSEHYPIDDNVVEEKEEEVLEKVSFYIKDKTRRGMRIFN